MAAYGNMTEAVLGMKADPGFNSRVESRVAKAAINFGYPVFGYIGDSQNCSELIVDTSKIVYSADFVASDDIDVTVNGTAITTVSYATSHLATITAVVAAIDAISGVEAKLDTSDTNNRTILIRTQWAANTTSTTVTSGGDGTATGTVTYFTDQIFLGFALKNDSLVTTVGYVAYDMVSVLNTGVVYAYTSKAVSANDGAYALTASGALTDSSTSSISINSIFRSTATVAGIVQVEAKGQYKPNSIYTTV